MNMRSRLYVLTGCFMLNFLMAAWVLPLEPTPQQLGAILEREYGAMLDAPVPRGRDLPGPIQAMVQEKNLRDLATSERELFRNEQWILRGVWTFLGGTTLAAAILLGMNRLRRAGGSHPGPVPAIG